LSVWCIDGAWNHAQRSYDRGYLAHPPVFFGVESLPSPPPPVFHGVELLDEELLPPPPPPVFHGVESPPVFHGAELVFAESVVQYKDISLPTIISLAEHLPNITKSAPIDSKEFGFELRRRIREWAPIPTGSFGIPLRRLARGPSIEDRGAIDILDNTGPATCEAFYIGDEDALPWLLKRKQWRTIFVRVAFWWLSLAISRQMFVMLQTNAKTLSIFVGMTMP